MSFLLLVNCYLNFLYGYYISRGSIFAGLISTNKVRIGSSLVSPSSEIELVGWFIRATLTHEKETGTS